MFGRFLLFASYVFGAAMSPTLAGDDDDERELVQKKVTNRDVLMVATMPGRTINGTPANLTIRLENQGKNDIVLSFRSKYWDYDLQLFEYFGNRLGKPVPLTRFGSRVYGPERKKIESEKITLAPGKHWEATLNVARVFDLSGYGEMWYLLDIRCQVHDLKTKDAIHLKIDDLRFKRFREKDSP